jgi:hypothetical protein
VSHTFTKERLEQRIAAFTRFVQEQGLVLIDLGLGKYHNHHFLVREQDHYVEVTFTLQGGIYLSVEAGSSPEHWIRPRLNLWIEQEHPRYRGEHSGHNFSDLAVLNLPTLASTSSAQAYQGESADILFPNSDEAEEVIGGLANQQWISEHFSVYVPQEEFPSYGSATVPRWVTTPEPAVQNGRAGTVVTMEFLFDASEPWLREQFALHIQQLVAREGSVVLNTIPFPNSALVSHRKDHATKATGRNLTAIHLLLFRPQDSQQNDASASTL